MTKTLRCAGPNCRHRFGRRATVWINDGATVALCASCASNSRIHRQLWFGCREPGHTPADHCHPVTRGLAASLQALR
jgi:hypothetical protein